MSFLEVHPGDREMLQGLGLRTAADFLRLDGEILGGHPDRHVLQVTLGTEPAFLKKEHRVTWRDRLANWWRGFGGISKSAREGRMLVQLEAAGIGAPHAIAHGEADGQAFLLLRKEAGVEDLRIYLEERPLERLAVAEALGRDLARVHAAGFHHRDLYSKHVLVGHDDRGWRFCFLDWQRGRRLRSVPWIQRLRDLATLDATLAGNLATRRERLLGWRAYLAAQSRTVARPHQFLRTLCRMSARLQRKRRIRELRQRPLPTGRQNLIWLDGEALCVTPRFLETAPKPPAWLAMPDPPPASNFVEAVALPFADAGRWKLIRRWTSRPWRWLASWWRRPLFPAPEFEQAAAMIRLERYGVEVPRLLALGHRTLRPWRKYSFLLTEAPTDTIPLFDYLGKATPQQRWNALRQAGHLLRRVHEAGYAWHGQRYDQWAVRPATGAVVLTSVAGLQRTAVPPDRLARKNLTTLASSAWSSLSAADKLRFFLGYHVLDNLSRPGRQQFRLLTLQRRPTRPAGWKRQVAG